MSRKLLFLSVAIVGLLAFITFQNGEILFKEGKSVSSVNIVALAGDEFHHETWDDMELVTYLCDDGAHDGKSCELSSGYPKGCTYADEEYCPPTSGDNGNGETVKPNPDLQCPAGGYHNWRRVYIGGVLQNKCTKCGMLKGNN